MDKLLFAAAAALTVATPAAAQAAGGIGLTVAAKLPKACTINSNSQVKISVLSNEVRRDASTVAYSCNYIGVPTVTITSTNGALVSSEAGAVPVAYTIWFGDAAPPSDGTTWVPSKSLVGSGVSSTTAGPNGWTQTKTPNATVTTNLALFLKDTITVAGSYGDTLSISIVP